MPGVVVCGAMGRMGRAILSVLRERPYGLALAGAVETPGHPLLGQDAFEAAETMFRALDFRRVLFCLRDPKTVRLLGRFGLGEDIDAVARRFDIPLTAPADVPVDIFAAVCQKNLDTLISDSTEERIRNRLPAWYRDAVATPTFLLLPIAMKGSTFGLIYGDTATQGGITLVEREMSLVRTLRNQAVMAFRQAA